MKIRVCYGCPSKMIRELNEGQANLLTRYRTEDGTAYMEIRDSVEQEKPSHKWKYLDQQIISRPDPNNNKVEEDIICYIVEDIKPENKLDETGGWNTPSSHLSAHNEAPEYGGVRY